ncbi:hypothetical protein DICA2_F38248 [Diutina catenulata]
MDIAHLRQQARSSEWCRAVDERQLQQIVHTLTDPAHDNRADQQAMIAVVSNVLLVNRSLHQCYFTPYYSNQVLRHVVQHLAALPEATTADMVAGYRLVFLVLYDGIASEDAELLAVTGHILDRGLGYCVDHQLEPEATIEVLKAMYSLYHKYPQHTSAEVLHTVVSHFTAVRARRMPPSKLEQHLVNVITIIVTGDPESRRRDIGYVCRHCPEFGDALMQYLHHQLMEYTCRLGVECGECDSVANSRNNSEGGATAPVMTSVSGANAGGSGVNGGSTGAGVSATSAGATNAGATNAGATNAGATNAGATNAGATGPKPVTGAIDLSNFELDVEGALRGSVSDVSDNSAVNGGPLRVSEAGKAAENAGAVNAGVAPETKISQTGQQTGAQTGAQTGQQTVQQTVQQNGSNGSNGQSTQTPSQNGNPAGPLPETVPVSTGSASGAPIAHAPTANAPTANAPTANAPTANAPTANAPTANAPTARAPSVSGPTPNASGPAPTTSTSATPSSDPPPPPSVLPSSASLPSHPDSGRPSVTSTSSSPHTTTANDVSGLFVLITFMAKSMRHEADNVLISIFKRDMLPSRVQVPLVYEKSLAVICSPSSQAQFTPGDETKLRQIVMDCYFELCYDPSPKKRYTHFLEVVSYVHAKGYIDANHLEMPSSIDVSKYLKPRYFEVAPSVAPQSEAYTLNQSFKSILTAAAGVEQKKPEMSEQEKEREAEKLFHVFERMEQLGTFSGFKNPVRQWQEQGRFEELKEES